MARTTQEIAEEIVLLQHEAQAALLNLDFARLTTTNLRIRGLREILEAHQNGADASSRAEKTGAPGRPSSMHLVEAKAEQRRKTRQTVRVLADEAAALCEWFKAAHPAKPAPAPKTVKNRIRADHHTHWARK
jgi:hypothetical protein